MIHVVDTHALVWYLENSSRLGQAARPLLSDPKSSLVLPTIVLAEVRYLSASGRVTVGWEQVLRAVKDDARFYIYDLDLDVLELMPTELEIHDAIICATALFYRDILLEEVSLLTKDEKLIASGLVETVW